MYWPCGVPRIYADDGPEPVAANGEDIWRNKESDGPTAGQEQSSDQVTRQHPQPDQDVGRPEFLLDLQVARLDHIFATITESSLTIWQSRVSDPEFPPWSPLILRGVADGGSCTSNTVENIS